MMSEPIELASHQMYFQVSTCWFIKLYEISLIVTKNNKLNTIKPVEMAKGLLIMCPEGIFTV
jgi:hypothetical protein